MSFLEEFKKYDHKEVLDRIMGKTARDVERALQEERPGIEDFAALISPAAEGYLEQMAERSHRTTLQRFGNNIQMYVPLYISNECTNGCVYCGFNASNPVTRKTLSLDEIEQEALALHRQEFRHVLVLTGEAPNAVRNEDLAAAIRRIRPLFSSISIEVYPMDVAGYRSMVEAGVDGLTIYQETYDPELYAKLHLFGKKRDFLWRLGTPERGGEAGLRWIGIGALLGLGHFYVETFFTGCTRSTLRTASGARRCPSPSRASGRRKAGSRLSTRSATGRWCRGSAPCASCCPTAASPCRRGRAHGSATISSRWGSPR
jgi:2-iminoacetate synthase